MEVDGFLRNIAFPLLRFGTYAAHLLLFGLAVILLLVLRPAFRALGDDGWGPGRRRLAAGIEDIAQACLWAAALAAALILLLQTGLISELGTGEMGMGNFNSVIETPFGLWTVLRFPVLVALAVLLVRRVRKWGLEGLGDEGGAPPAWWWAWLVLGSALLTTSALAGHSISGRPQGLSVVNDVVHLAAGGIWLSGIVVLAALLPAAWRRRAELDRLRLVSLCVSGFARVALISMVVLVVTGTINSLFHVGRLADLWRSPYGQALFFKLGLFVFVLALGGITHFSLRTRLAAAVAAGDATPAYGTFRRSIAAELALGFGIIATTGVLTHLAPPP